MSVNQDVYLNLNNRDFIIHDKEKHSLILNLEHGTIEFNDSEESRSFISRFINLVDE